MFKNYIIKIYMYVACIKFSCMHTVMCLNLGTLKIINFPFETNGQLIIFSSPELSSGSAIALPLVLVLALALAKR